MIDDDEEPEEEVQDADEVRAVTLYAEATLTAHNLTAKCTEMDRDHSLRKDHKILRITKRAWERAERRGRVARELIGPNLFELLLK